LITSGRSGGPRSDEPGPAPPGPSPEKADAASSARAPLSARERVLAAARATRPVRVLIVTGEASGDLQGARLVEALWRVEPRFDIYAVGGEKMRAAGASIVEDSSTWGFIGFWDAIVRLPHLYRVYQRLRSAVSVTRPDLLILIDCPGFNMRLARHARSLGIRTLYYFPPSAWTRNDARARHIAARVDHVVAAFEYTEQTYRRAQQPCAYFGHPLIDVIKPGGSAEEIRARHGLPEGKRFVGLLPGSRRAEIERMGEPLLAAARLLSERTADLHFLVPVASPAVSVLVRNAVARYGDDLPVTVIEGGGTDVMTVSDLLVMTSGSASLEAVILETPMILTYRLAAFDYWLAHLVLSDFTYMGLPNLILQQPVVPELIQDQASPERIAQEAEGLLTDPERYGKMKDNLLKVKKQLGAPGVVDRVAQYIWETVSNGP
jgi:lipid-A-disaccharide synthase